MTKLEAVAVNKLLLALMAQKHTLAMVGIGIGMTSFDGEILDAAKGLSGIAHQRLGAGLDAAQIDRAWSNPAELQKVLAQIRQEARCA